MLTPWESASPFPCVWSFWWCWEDPSWRDGPGVESRGKEDKESLKENWILQCGRAKLCGLAQVTITMYSSIIPGVQFNTAVQGHKQKQHYNSESETLTLIVSLPHRFSKRAVFICCEQISVLSTNFTRRVSWHGIFRLEIFPFFSHSSHTKSQLL